MYVNIGGSGNDSEGDDWLKCFRDGGDGTTPPQTGRIGAKGFCRHIGGGGEGRGEVILPDLGVSEAPILGQELLNEGD